MRAVVALRFAIEYILPWINAVSLAIIARELVRIRKDREL